MTEAQLHLDRLDQRRRYLEKRIEAKQQVGWETVYDESERDALAWALDVIGEELWVQEYEPDSDPHRPAWFSNIRQAFRVLSGK